MEKNKSLEERYAGEQLSDNSRSEKCAQCKLCLFQSDGTAFSNHYQKGCCAMYPYPAMKPLGVMHNTEECDFFEKK